MRLRILFAALALTVATGLTAQVVPVNNTGCPGYAPPQWSGQPRLGQTITFTLQRRPTPRSFVFLGLGWPSGAGVAFHQPFTCVQGPCVWYPAPIGGSFYLVSDPFLASLPIAIPNDRGLLFQTFSVQGGNFESFGSCITLAQALSFAIQP